MDTDFSEPDTNSSEKVHYMVFLVSERKGRTMAKAEMRNVIRNPFWEAWVLYLHKYFLSTFRENESTIAICVSNG